MRHYIVVNVEHIWELIMSDKYSIYAKNYDDKVYKYYKSTNYFIIAIIYYFIYSLKVDYIDMYMRK